MSSFDNWLLRQADEYWEDCKPKAVDYSIEYEGDNEDGSLINSYTPIFNCKFCNEKDCEYWEKYHDN